MSALLEAAFQLALVRDQAGVRSDLRARGVVPTPVALARHAVARVDQLLRGEFALDEGLASDRVVVIDPAVGTGVWLAAVLECTGERRVNARAMIGIDVEPETLRSVSALLASEAERQGVQLALRSDNTLEIERVLAEEDDRVRVILGNPPWAARSLSRGGLLSDRWLSEFRHDAAGRPLGERRAGVLSDDYVRFYRWALEQARASKAGAIVCLATNGSFLDGPVHRGMRGALVSAFDRLELLDLGGNALLSASGVVDENLFGVRVGAALSVAVRRPGSGVRAARVTLTCLRGSRAEKLSALGEAARVAEQLAPCAPWFGFRPHTPSAPVAGGEFSLAEAFPFHREGVQTNRDALCIAPSRAALEERLRAFAQGELSAPAARHFDAERARRVVAQALAQDALAIEPLAYRPLDDRYVAALVPLCHRPRPELLRAVAHSELCLLAVRKERGGAPFNLFGVARHVADACYLSVRSSCRTRVFPSHGADGCENLGEPVRDVLVRRVGRAVTSSELIAYALAVLGSPRFRAAHDAELKLDYARLPYPRDAGQFEHALSVGARFTAALVGSRGVAEPLPFVVDGPPTRALSIGELRFDPELRTLEHAGERLVSELAPSAWRALVGHHTLVRSALSGCTTPTTAELAEALCRATLWVRAEQAADALLMERTAR